MASARKPTFYTLVCTSLFTFCNTYSVDYSYCLTLSLPNYSLILYIININAIMVNRTAVMQFTNVMSTSGFLLDSSDAGGQDNQSATLCGRLHKHPFLIWNLSTAATTEDQSTTSLFEFPASWPLSIVAKISDKLAVYLINSSWESSSSLESWQRSESDNMDCYFLKRKDCDIHL